MYSKGCVEIEKRGGGYIKRGHAYLPHSCDEWVIGEAEEVQMLIDDLQDILREMKEEE